MYEKAPLYRRINTRARGVHTGGGEYAWSRHAKAEQRNDAPTGAMRGLRHGLDYTPLFRFLLSKVGAPWSEVHSEAVGRLDRAEPIFWLVAPSKEGGKPLVRIGENTYWSGLFVDADGRLARVDPELQVEDLTPGCPCCTHTLNGKAFSRKFDGLWGYARVVNGREKPVK